MGGGGRERPSETKDLGTAGKNLVRFRAVPALALPGAWYVVMYLISGCQGLKSSQLRAQKISQILPTWEKTEDRAGKKEGRK